MNGLGQMVAGASEPLATQGNVNAEFAGNRRKDSGV
jgi:hypothetical protein